MILSLPGFFTPLKILLSEESVRPPDTSAGPDRPP